MWVGDRGTEMEGDKYRLLYWLITSSVGHTHTLLFSDSGRTSFPLLQDILNRSSSRGHLSPCGHSSLSADSTNCCKTAVLWDIASAAREATCWRSPWLTKSLLASSWDWLKTDCISRGHLYISFHNTHHFHSPTLLLLLIYTGMSCAEKSLIDSSVKGQ